MAVENDFELLDDYLSNRLSGEDKMAFEKKLEADPELSQEYAIQKNLVEGLKQARALELKSMLNNIPVSPVQGGQSLLTKVGTWAVVAGLIATGIYFYSLNEKGNGESVTQEEAVVPEHESEPASEISKAPETSQAEQTEKEEVKKPAEKTIGKKKTESTPEASEAVANKPIEVYDPSKEDADEANKKYEREQLDIISKAFVTSSMEVETDTMNKKYSFHYVFKDSKLVLYGAFEKNLYEILEFIGDEKRTVVLFYKNNYYLLDIDKATPTKLIPIRDRKLLKKLQDHRSK